MDISLTSPESTNSGLKQIFKEPTTNFYDAFEVSMHDESIAPQSNKSDCDLEVTSTTTQKVLPFSRKRKSIQQRFSFSTVDSSNCSESEQSVTFVKPRDVFKNKNKSVDFFNVSFNASDLNSQKDDLGKTLDESTIFGQVDPFTKAKTTQHEISVRELSLQDSNHLNEESDTTTPPTKNNPFKKSKNQTDELQISVTDENKTNCSKSQKNELGKTLDESAIFGQVDPFMREKTTENEISPREELSLQDSNHLNEESNITTPATKNNPFKKSKNQTDELQISVTDENKTNCSKSQKDELGKTLNGLTILGQVDSFMKEKTTENEISPREELSLQDIYQINEESDTTTPASRNNPFRQSKNKTDELQISLTVGNKTNSSKSQKDKLRKAVDKSTIFDQVDPFTKGKTTENEISPREELSIQDSYQINEEFDTPTLTTKNNPFRKSKNKTDELQMSLTDGNKTNSSKSSEDSDDTSPAQRLNCDDHETHTVTSNIIVKQKPVKKPGVKKTNTDSYKREKLAKPASFVTKKLYNHIIKKLKPKYGIDTMIESENIVTLICDTVKKVTRRKTHQKNLINKLKKEMAKVGLVETTMDFYEFVIHFLPYSFRVKVVPCLQPETNVVYPPKDVKNPFDKIL